jgi:PKD repeat protein
MLILLLIAGVTGAILSYLWTEGYYVDKGFNIPEDTTVITILDVAFPLGNSTYFNVTVLNPSFSIGATNITNIGVATSADNFKTIHLIPGSSAEPTLPHLLLRGESRTLRCHFDWGSFAGETIRVFAFLADGSGATYPYETGKVKLEILNVELNTSISIKRFNVTVGNSAESLIPLNVTELMFDMIAIPTENITTKIGLPPFPQTLQPGHNETFFCHLDLLQLDGFDSIYNITARTAEGYSAQFAMVIPPAVQLNISSVIFAQPETSSFQLTILNLLTSPHSATISHASIESENETFSNIELTPSSGDSNLNPGENRTFTANWNWGNFIGAELQITGYTTQGFLIDGFLYEVDPTFGFPEAVFTYELHALSVDFNASGSYDTYGDIVNWSWDFGDGMVGSGEVTSHIYNQSGEYTVTLNVTDNDGLSAETALIIDVYNTPPLASFTVSNDTVYTLEPVFFNASQSSDPDGDIVAFLWDFNDGGIGEGEVANHTYTEDGIYEVTLTVEDDLGSTTNASITITVLNRSPEVSFTESTLTPLVNENVTFNATQSFDLDGTIIKYLWDFGDGTNSTEVIATHNYSTNGTFIVTLYVTDDDNSTTSTNKTVTVTLPSRRILKLMTQFEENPIRQNRILENPNLKIFTSLHENPQGKKIKALISN